MALNREAERLRRLQLIARMMRDRDLAAVASVVARRRETEQQIAALAAHDGKIRDDLAAATDAGDMMQAQAYCRLIGSQMACLQAERKIRAEIAEAGLHTARRSFARAMVADALNEAATEKLREKSARKDER